MGDNGVIIGTPVDTVTFDKGLVDLLEYKFEFGEAF